jgi:hypothetical protein
MIIRGTTERPKYMQKPLYYTSGIVGPKLKHVAGEKKGRKKGETYEDRQGHERIGRVAFDARGG